MLATSPRGAPAQPRWGCLYCGSGPRVAPRRRNPGLWGRIPLGFPEGKSVNASAPSPPGFASIHGFPSPTSTTLCHKARGCAGRRTTPGGRGRSATTTTWLCRGYERVGCPAQGGLRCCKAISRCAFRRIRARAGNLPAWCPGTTPLGWFILWEWTQGSASAAQPWALGQNPVGIPGGKIGQRLCTIPPRIRVHPRFPLPNVNDVVP